MLFDPWPLVLALALFPASTLHAQNFSGYAFVQDDAMLRVGHRVVRLYGIHVPLLDEGCHAFERPPRCAPRAALALGFKVRDFVHCETRSRDAQGVVTALCRAGGDVFDPGDDLSAYLLERGWAVALPDAPVEYQALEKIARSRGLGMWGFPGRINRP